MNKLTSYPSQRTLAQHPPWEKWENQTLESFSAELLSDPCSEGLPKSQPKHTWTTTSISGKWEKLQDDFFLHPKQKHTFLTRWKCKIASSCVRIPVFSTCQAWHRFSCRSLKYFWFCVSRTGVRHTDLQQQQKKNPPRALSREGQHFDKAEWWTSGVGTSVSFCPSTQTHLVLGCCELPHYDIIWNLNSCQNTKKI